MSEVNKRAQIEYLQSLVAEYRARAEKAEEALCVAMAVLALSQGERQP